MRNMGGVSSSTMQGPGEMRTVTRNDGQIGGRIDTNVVTRNDGQIGGRTDTNMVTRNETTTRNEFNTVTPTVRRDNNTSSY